MTIAHKYIKQLDLIPLDELGFYNRRLADGWIARVRHASVHVTFPQGLSSYDATERHEFEDGSELTVGNPDQIAFSLNVYEEEK